MSRQVVGDLPAAESEKKCLWTKPHKSEPLNPGPHRAIPAPKYRVLAQSLNNLNLPASLWGILNIPYIVHLEGALAVAHVLTQRPQVAPYDIPGPRRGHFVLCPDLGSTSGL